MGTNTVAVQLDHEKVKRMRELITKLLADEIDGLAERARIVGYSRESMHLQPNAEGALLLIHLEYEHDQYATLHDRIVNFPDTAFTDWWTPQFGEIVGPLPRNEELFVWIDETI